ncbi:Cutinase palindrome-binding protein [Tolypocladium capitatum]|uniref:Cutinase palindrome-binding protein n=1 Tax=Tolypocladium capitatum TaxID=45235 RepID=A0A2K3QKD4_9HYPO|nr:Cutinase palindrome-binding protein [Tolypocladium capitatum]
MAKPNSQLPPPAAPCSEPLEPPLLRAAALMAQRPPSTSCSGRRLVLSLCSLPGPRTSYHTLRWAVADVAPYSVLRTRTRTQHCSRRVPSAETSLPHLVPSSCCQHPSLSLPPTLCRLASIAGSALPLAATASDSSGWTSTTHPLLPPLTLPLNPHQLAATMDHDQSSFFGFSNLDLGEHDGNDIMSFLDHSMLGPFDDVAMALDPGDDGTAPQAFNPNADDVNDARLPGTGGATEESIARAESQFNTAANNVPGAGPLPPGSFPQSSLASGSTLTEFTKRRNWPAKVVEELKDFLHILDANGRIKYASPSVLGVAGYTAEEILDVFLKDLIHPDDQGVFVAELNESIASGNPLRMFYRFKKKGGVYAIFEAVGHAHIAGAKFAPNPSNQSPFCQAVFMMARPYPTKNAGLLDSFLEHKIENERLRRRIAELRREEEADADEAQRQWAQSQEGRSDVTPSTETGASVAPFFLSNSAANDTMSQSDRNALNIALTRENLEGAEADSPPDSLRDKMARYEGTSHTDTIEMLTGLRYMEGERSRGITTGNASPTLIRGDAGIAIPVDRDSRPGEKKKKLKTSEEYVCTDCGTLDSPEWRKGPNGPKTLCNACGLRWAKKEKKRNNASQPMVDHAMG